MTFKVGQVCILHSLIHCPQYNGEIVTITAGPRQGRYLVDKYFPWMGTQCNCVGERNLRPLDPDWGRTVDWSDVNWKPKEVVYV